MNLIDKLFGSSFFTKKQSSVLVSPSPVREVVYDGEINAGSLGNPINLIPNEEIIRYRANEAMLTSDVIKSISSKYFKFVVGQGLILKAEPNIDVLKSEGINEDLKNFVDLSETRFKVWSKSKLSDYSEQKSLHKLALDAFTTAFVGGDCLVVCRIDKQNNLKVQVIDGSHLGSSINSKKLSESNTITKGVERDEKGKHAAYHLKNGDRIDAYGKKTGRKLAWLVYGSKARIDHVRGMSEISSILEKDGVLKRYTEATVTSAEERAKIAYAIQHGMHSNGENPLAAKIAAVQGNAGEKVDFETVRKNIQATTQKTVINMPQDSELKSLESDQEVNYPEFFNAIFEQECSAMDIPPEVAKQMYNSNYSASRAAINNWGYIIDIKREDLAEEFYKPIYNLWLELEVLKNKISSNGFKQALREKNLMAIEAYTNARFQGLKMPHIDPLKEVKAVREMIAENLISKEQATEILNLGDWWENREKINNEQIYINENYAAQTENPEQGE